MNFQLRGLCLLSMVAINASFALQASAKVWSIDERQQQLMQDINQGQRSKQLTDKNAKKLRELLSNVARKKKKFQKGDSTSKAFSDAQKSALQTELDKVRAEMTKMQTDNKAEN